ncbi:UNVERIFIED_CONTAM: hypothetical protein HDU68_005903 [Siphonaria sp. JEL0065]|nr:hypothetical protein HDU68_005903 [Siphonaria sp. JEL0065]
MIRAMEELKIPYGFDPTTVSDVGFASEELVPLSSAGSALDMEMPEMPELPDKSGINSGNNMPDKRGSLFRTKSILGSSGKLKKRGTFARKLEKHSPIAKAATSQYKASNGNKNGPMAELAHEILLQQESILSLPNCAKRLKAFWEDEGVKYCFSRAYEYQMLDCCL